MSRSQSSHKIAMQDELNDMEVSTEFDVVTNTSQMLALVFYAMTYSAGLPILMPLSCLTFIVYFSIHKRLLCRFYKRPAKIDDAIIRSVIRFLPYAALIRLAFSCWILSNNTILPATFPKFALNTPGVAGANTASHSNSDTYLAYLAGLRIQVRAAIPDLFPEAQERLLKPNIFPLFLIFVLIIAAKLLIKIWPYLPINWFRVTAAFIYKSYCRKKRKVYVDDSGVAFLALHGYDILKDDHPYRQEMAPFTGDYFKYVCDKDDLHVGGCCGRGGGQGEPPMLSEEEQLVGWIHIDQGKYVVKSKQWLDTTLYQGITRIRGDFKRTYEVVRDGGCISSYSLLHIPAYRMAYVGLMEGANTVKENIKKSRKSKRRAHRDADGRKIHFNDAEQEWTKNLDSIPSPSSRQQRYILTHESDSSEEESGSGDDEDSSEEDSDSDEDDSSEDESGSEEDGESEETATEVSSPSKSKK
jgi:hypothetical protein